MVEEGLKGRIRGRVWWKTTTLEEHRSGKTKFHLEERHNKLRRRMLLAAKDCTSLWRNSMVEEHVGRIDRDEKNICSLAKKNANFRVDEIKKYCT